MSRAAVQAPALLPREVHVWVADLDRPAARAREECASREELERADASLRPAAARTRVRARGVLHELLESYAHTDLCVSVSHSGSLAAYAFTRTCPVGVDLETPRRARAVDAPRGPTRKA
jgi:predicted transcriptional regulator of viral defense system